jgi:hypothetical protein
MITEPCPAMEKIRSPVGDCITVKAYQEYVCRMLREELSFDDVRDLLGHFHCRIEELVDRILEQKMVRARKGKRKE